MPETDIPTEAALDGALACLARSASDMRMLKVYGLERVDPAAFEDLMTAISALSCKAGMALASAGRCPPAAPA